MFMVQEKENHVNVTIDDTPRHSAVSLTFLRLFTTWHLSLMVCHDSLFQNAPDTQVPTLAPRPEAPGQVKNQTASHLVPLG